MSKKWGILFALGVISLAVFIVSAFMGVICQMNENIENPEWREIGKTNCHNMESITQWLSNFVDFIGNTFVK